MRLGFFEILFCASLLVALFSANAKGQEAVEDLKELLDKKVDIRLTKDAYIVDAVVTSFNEGKLPKSVKNLKVSLEGSKKSKNVSVARVKEIYLGGYPLDIQYDRKNKCLVHSPEQRAARLEQEKLISERLAVTRDRLWKPLTDAQQEKFMATHRKFIKKVQSDTPGLRLVETEFFLFLTDLNDKDLSGYIGYLDAMTLSFARRLGFHQKRIFGAASALSSRLRRRAGI